MKKSISIIMCMVLILILVGGCNTTESNPKADNEEIITKPVTITIWHDKEAEVAKTLQSILDPLAPEIIVELERKDGLTDSLKLVGNDPSSAPDMYFFAHDKIGVYAEMGILAPITDFIDEEVLDDYVDMTLEAATYKEVMYQLPIYFETLLFMYNKELMSEDEIPKTTEALYSYMQEKTVDGKYGFVEQHSTAYYSVPWIHGFGGEVINKEGMPQLTSSEVFDALDYHRKFLEYMPTESEYSTVNTLFMEGLASATINGPWLVPSAREAGLDIGFASMPVVDATGIPLAPYAGVQGIHVLKVAKESKFEAITKVLEQILLPELGINMAQVSGSAPANQKCYDDVSVSDNEMIQMMKETAESAVPMPNIPEMDVMFVVTGNLLVAVNMNGADIEEKANDLQEKAIRLIEAMK